MPGKEIILTAEDIDRRLVRMAHEILEKHRGGDNLALVGIHTRGVYLARRLRDRLEETDGHRPPCGEVDINLYRDDWTSISRQPVLGVTDIPFSIDGRSVILVDDVLYTGRTVRSAMDALVDFGRPARIELAVLVDRGHRELPIMANFVGETVETRQEERVNVYLAEVDGRDGVVLD